MICQVERVVTRLLISSHNILSIELLNDTFLGFGWDFVYGKEVG
jgi:hypothetical protein